MQDNIAEIENNMKKIKDTEFGKKYNIVLSLSELDEIPIKSFEQLQGLLRSREAIMRQYPLSISGNIFNLISTSSEQVLFYVSQLLNYLVPILGIILSFVYSWWFLLLLPAPIFTTQFGKRIYLKALFDRSVKSEIAFCFLYCCRLITIELPNQGIIGKDI